MKRKDFNELKQKSMADLTKELMSRRQVLAKHELEQKVKQIKNTRQKVTLRHDIAKILTVMKIANMQKQGEKKT